MKPKYFLNPKVALRKSRVGGKELYTKEKISKREIIHVSEGKIISNEALKKLPKKFWGFPYSISESHSLCPKDFNATTPDWYINHSCDPNAGSGGDCYTLLAMRDIEKGEAITYDYAMTDSYSTGEMVCRCGSQKCRKIVTAEDWKIPDLQKRYKGFFQKNIQKKIDAKLS